jgi:hypothetical protein
MNSQIANKESKTSSDSTTKSHQAYAMEESRLKTAKENCMLKKDCAEFNSLGGDNRLREVENLVKTNQDANKMKKKVGMDAGRENQFIKTHEKDRDNANPTAIGGLPKMTKGSINRKIMTNKEVYNEELSKEISFIKYLIEYMNNNNKKII